MTQYWRRSISFAPRGEPASHPKRDLGRLHQTDDWFLGKRFPVAGFDFDRRSTGAGMAMSCGRRLVLLTHNRIASLRNNGTAGAQWASPPRKGTVGQDTHRTKRIEAEARHADSFSAECGWGKMAVFKTGLLPRGIPTLIVKGGPTRPGCEGPPLAKEKQA